MDHTVLYRNIFSLVLISCFIKTLPLKEQHTRCGENDVHKGFCSSAFPRKSRSSCSSPRLLTLGLRCFSYSLFSAAVSDQAIGPSTPRLCLLMFKSSPVPSPALCSATSTKHMQERWNFSCLTLPIS